MVRTPQDHLGPQPITPTCDLLPAGCCSAAPGAVLGSLCSLGPRHTQGTQHSLLTSPATHLCQEQPLSLTHQGRHRPGPRIRAGQGGTPVLRAGKGPRAPRPVRVAGAGSGLGLGWILVLDQEALTRPSVHWRGASGGDVPAEASQALPFPCTWQGEEGPHMLRAQVELRLRKQLRWPLAVHLGREHWAPRFLPSSS